MRKYIAFFVAIFMFLIFDVNAKENVYFTNSFGVEMTELEFNNIEKIYGIGYADSIDLDTFNLYYDFYSFENLEIESVSNDEFSNLIIPFSNTQSTEFKNLTITSIKNSYSTLITINLKWKKMPIIRSYDVFGFRMNNGTYSRLSAKVLFDGVLSNSQKNVVKTNKAYGFSVKLPTNCSQIAMSISFTTTSSGKIYASYQHAVENISLNDSTNYVFSSNGLGGVFLFGDCTFFDKMPGVDITI